MQSAVMFQETIRPSGNPIFNDNWRSLSYCPRPTKQTLKLRNKSEAPKELLEYRGPRAAPNCGDSGIASVRTTSVSPDLSLSEVMSDFDKLSVTSADSFNDKYSHGFFCQACFLVECQRRADAGQPLPTASEFGPWLSHSAKDSKGREQCPMVYFNLCVCGPRGQVHKLSECSQVGMVVEQALIAN